MHLFSERNKKMAVKYKGYLIEYVECRGDYRISDCAARSGIFNYAPSIKEAKRTIDELEFKRTDERRHNALINMGDYLSSHNYGKMDYPFYSQDPEWQRLNHELDEAVRAHNMELKDCSSISDSDIDDDIDV